MAVQGNLDPTVLYAPKEIIEREVKRVLDENAGRPGHIFNLGHGILPTVPPENAIYHGGVRPPAVAEVAYE